MNDTQKHAVFFLACLLMALVSIPARAIGSESDRYLYPEYQQQGLELVPVAYREAFWLAHGETGVPLPFAVKLAKAESRFNPRARNYNTNGTVDRGLFQLNSRWLPEFAKKYNRGVKIDPYNPEVNIRVAFRILAALHRKHHNWVLVVINWNGAGKKLVLPASTLRLIKGVFE